MQNLSIEIKPSNSDLFKILYFLSLKKLNSLLDLEIAGV
jgi:hypothetical protein